MRIIIIGPPGSGKGTRAKIVGRLYGVPVLTSGDMLREAAAEGTEHGKIAEEYMNRGDLVPMTSSSPSWRRGSRGKTPEKDSSSTGSPGA